jgi:DNA-binding Lrp family transcriptional regulator
MTVTGLQQRLLNDFQRNFPLTPTPYADMADKLGVSEVWVLATLRQLRDSRYISRVGAVFSPNSVGASQLAAMAVPAERLDSVAEWVSASMNTISGLYSPLVMKQGWRKSQLPLSNTAGYRFYRSRYSKNSLSTLALK